MRQGRVEIKGDAGNVVNAESGAIVNVFINRPNQANADQRSVYLLLSKCERLGIKPMLERVALKCFGTCLFKALTPDQLATLHEIADEVSEVLYRSRGM
jgi:hypothetical protein